MPKIGRNQLCPCGSGRKYKHCCLRSRPDGVPSVPAAGIAISLRAAIADIQKAAARRNEQRWRLGVFLFFSTRHGDAWVLEVTERDGLQVAGSGEPLNVELKEDGEVIEVDWSYGFRLENRQLIMSAYREDRSFVVAEAPFGWIKASMGKVLKQCSPELLSQIHVDE